MAKAKISQEPAKRSKAKRKSSGVFPAVLDPSKPLKNNRYELFCREYTVDLNKTQAAIRAKYSKKTASQKGEQLFRIVDIKNRVAYLMGKITKRAEKTADDVIRELEKIGFSNVQDYIRPGNGVLDLSQIPRDTAAAVESIQVDVRHDGGGSTGYTEKVKFKLYDKKSALVDLGRRHGIFGKDNEQSRCVLHRPEMK